MKVLAQARSYCARPNFTLIENGRNTGFSYAVNQGIARAQERVCGHCSTTMPLPSPQWLAELIRTAETDPKIFAVQSLMLRHFERELADDAGDYVTWMGFACKTGDGRRASRYTKQKRIFSACGGAALYRKSILDEIGTFDENFFTYFEDVDLSWRANNAGYKNVSSAPPPNATTSAVPAPAR
ncbi:MAG: glycosyltransferase [Faecalibacterium sp.]